VSALRSLTARLAALDEAQPVPHEGRLALLRAQLADVVAGGKPSGPPCPTGLAGLDAALGGGVPRGRLTEIVGAPGGGMTTLVRALVARTLGDGGWVAVIDATRTLAPRDWGGLVARHGPRLWVVRPPLAERRRTAWCADLLLRTGAFALVVLDGAPVLRRATAVRLAQLARERDAVLVACRPGERASDLGGAVRLVVAAPAAPRGRQPAQRLGQQGAQADESTPDRLVVRLVRGGQGHGQQQVEVRGVIEVADRLCAHPEVPDRRGVARRQRHKWELPAAAAPAGAGGAGERAAAAPATGGGAAAGPGSRGSGDHASGARGGGRTEFTRGGARAHAAGGGVGVGVGRGAGDRPALGRAAAGAHRRRRPA
jgi:hypothetical protein